MTPESIKSKRIFSIFLLGCLVFNFPILSLFNYKIFIWGIPLLYIYLFFVWGVIIISLILITSIHPKKYLPRDKKPKPSKQQTDNQSSPKPKISLHRNGE